MKINAERMRAMLLAGDVAGALAMLEAGKRGGRPEVWPWSVMEIGEAFDMAGVKLASARVAAHRAGKRHRRGFHVSGHDGAVYVVRTE